MKPLLLLFLILSATDLWSQNIPSQYIEVNFVLPKKKVTITLSNEANTIYTSTSDSSIILIYQDLEPGFYRLTITDSINKSELRDSIEVSKEQRITANISMGNPCPYNYPENHIPICPADHKNQIIEIRYRNEKNKVLSKKYHLVGYTAAGCIPRYYCNSHKIKF